MAQLLKLYNENPNERVIRMIVATLQKGGLIVFPTDTVYSLGCDLHNPKALKKLALLKGVKIEKADFSFVTNSLSHLSEYVRSIDTPTYKLLKRCLPGPFTFIMNGVSKLPKPFTNKKTVGIRIPDNSIVQALIEELGNPMAVTSLKDDDEIIKYTTDPEIIYENWQKHVDIIIDAGYGGNKPSTVVDITDSEPIILRKGKGDLSLL
ncbi:MAG TPA: threonylcarbamoyl-AMP synthase [Lutibacter sp.]|nr:threonylcarbamoyl-AMP synthase [Lutibacter sp.]